MAQESWKCSANLATMAFRSGLSPILESSTGFGTQTPSSSCTFASSERSLPAVSA